MFKNSLCLVLLLSSVIFTDILEGADPADLVFIANISNTIDPAEINAEAILKGQQRNWVNGARIVLVLPGKQAETYEHVSLQIFGETGMMMQRRWLKLVFSGRGNPPKYAASEKEIIDFVLKTPGAAAVIRAQNHDSLGALLVKAL